MRSFGLSAHGPGRRRQVAALAAVEAAEIAVREVALKAELEARDAEIAERIARKPPWGWVGVEYPAS